MLEPEFDREQLRKFNKKGYRSVAARYAQSAELMLIQLEDELKQLKEDCKPFEAQITQRKTYKVTPPFVSG